MADTLDSFRVGVDIGGTFTDIIFLDRHGRMLTRKVSSTPDDFTRAIASGIQEVIAGTGLGGHRINEVVHACTVATNTILEHTGAATGLITTRGFRDVLEIRRIRMPELYNLHWNKPSPLVPGERRFEVDERIDADGSVSRPLDEAGVRAAVDELVSLGVTSVAVCLINSYVNPAHEQRIREIIRAAYPELPVTVSADLVPLVGEYERTSESVVNAYIKPVVKNYLLTLGATLERIEVKAPLLVMTSSGGMFSAEASMEKPLYMIECGPAAGVVGANYISRQLGIPNVITLDMGGTTSKASVIENNQLSRALQYEVGAGISVASRLCTGGGYVIRVPSIDIAEIGAGGGSQLWVDVGGALHVGPRSAGAVPGPVCYDAGGTEPTLTDANLVLGYLNPEYLAGGTVRLKADKSLQAIEEKVARPLEMDTIETAYGGHMIANSDMIRAIRAVSTERGRDPRDFTLMAYGGAGPMHAAAVARELGIGKVVVMPNPGLFSAFGLLVADIEHHLTQNFMRRLDASAVASANEVWQHLYRCVMAEIEAGGYGDIEVLVERYIDARYTGQAWELTLPVPWETLRPEHVPMLAQSFGEEHLRTYAHRRADQPIDIVNLRLVARIPSTGEMVHQGIKTAVDGGDSAAAGKQLRQVYYGKEYGWQETPILGLHDLSREARPGPAIIELYDATCVVPPDCDVALGHWNTIEINVLRQGG